MLSVLPIAVGLCGLLAGVYKTVHAYKSRASQPEPSVTIDGSSITITGFSPDELARLIEAVRSVASSKGSESANGHVQVVR